MLPADFLTTFARLTIERREGAIRLGTLECEVGMGTRGRESAALASLGWGAGAHRAVANDPKATGSKVAWLPTWFAVRVVAAASSSTSGGWSRVAPRVVAPREVGRLSDLMIMACLVLADAALPNDEPKRRDIDTPKIASSAP